MYTSPDGILRRTGAAACRAAALAALSLLAAALGCHRTGETGTAGTTARRGADTASVPVVVASVAVKKLPLTIEAIGVVEPLRTVAVRSLVGGTLLRIHFGEGHEVKKGDLLFEIDPRPYENAVHSAEADLEKTTVQLKTAEAQVERYAALITGGMVSREQFETVQNAAQALKAARSANLAALANARLQLEYCSIHAPCDGRTGALGAHEGDLVRASDPNVALVTVTQLTPIYVTFAVPQQNLAAIQRYSAAGAIQVSAALTGSEKSTDDGSLSFIDSAVDAATGTIKLRATFSNTSHVLWPGQFAHVAVNLATLPNQIVVPTPAVQTGQRGAQVYVVRPDLTAELRPVVIERAVGNETVITKGVAAGETVVVDGHIRLRPNAAVSVKPPVEDVPAMPGPAKHRTAVEAGTSGTHSDAGAATAADRAAAAVAMTREQNK